MTCERCQLEISTAHEGEVDCILALRHEVCALRLRVVALDKAAEAERARDESPSSAAAVELNPSGRERARG